VASACGQRLERSVSTVASACGQRAQRFVAAASFAQLSPYAKAASKELHWLDNTLLVFHGTTRNERDKNDLMTPILGLYGELFAYHSALVKDEEKGEELGEHVGEDAFASLLRFLFERIQENKEAIFPATAKEARKTALLEGGRDSFGNNHACHDEQASTVHHWFNRKTNRFTKTTDLLFGTGSSSLVARLEQLLESDHTLTASLQMQVMNRRDIARERLNAYTAERSVNLDRNKRVGARRSLKRLSAVGVWLRASSRSRENRSSASKCNCGSSDAQECCCKQPAATKLFHQAPRVPRVKCRTAVHTELGPGIRPGTSSSTLIASQLQPHIV